MIDLQQKYYTRIESQRLGSRWGVDFTQKLWQIPHKLWKHRCNHLFENDIVEDLSGLPQLKQAIVTDYRSGRGDLPQVYSSFFHLPLHALLTKNIAHLKRWFLIVRTAREAHTI